ncbi:MAG TPA: hypothetical protein VIG08_15020 [Gemmatimonadales bacterium]|jgi:hypothetical protein
MRRASSAAALAGVAVLLGFVCYTTFVAPRPYYVTDIDSEQDYYYNAQMAANGLPLSVHHPGTPIHQLGRLILAVVGPGLEHTQQFVDLAYVVAALASAIAIVTFIRLVMRDEPFGVSMLALACVLAWPTFLTYLNNFGVDSFIVALGLPTLAWFWVSLSQPIERTRRALIFSGVGLGVCLAAKMTFVPVVAAVGVTALVRAWIRTPRDQSPSRRVRATLAGIAPLVGSALLSYLVATAPIVGRLFLVWRQTFHRPDAFPQGNGFLRDFLKTIGVVVEANPLLVSVAGAVIMLVGVLTLAEIRRPTPVRGSNQGGPGDEFDFVAGGVLVAVMALGFAYTVAASASIVTEYSEAGIRLRNISPSALFIPFAVAYCARWARAHESAGAARALWVQAGLATIAIAVLTLGITRYLTFRREFIHDRVRRIEVTQSRINRLSDGPRRVAFWTGSDQDFLGPASFHFWGNYRYANNQFDRQLLEHFPNYAFLRLRNIERQSRPAGPPPTPSRYGRIGELYRSIMGWLLADRPYYRDLGGFFTGEAEGLRVSTIAFPARELHELPSLSLIDLGALVASRFGTPRVWAERVGDIDWIFLEVPRPGEAPPAGRP